MTSEAYILDAASQEPASKESIGLFKNKIRELAFHGRDSIDSGRTYASSHFFKDAKGDIPSTVEIIVSYSSPTEKTDANDSQPERFELTRVRYADLSSINPELSEEEFLYQYSISLVNNPDDEKRSAQAYIKMDDEAIRQLSDSYPELDYLFDEWLSTTLYLRKADEGIVTRKADDGCNVIDLKQPQLIANEGLIRKLLDEELVSKKLEPLNSEI